MELGKNSPKLKAWARLSQARARRQQGLVLVEGPAVVSELLLSRWSLEALIVEPELHPQLTNQVDPQRLYQAQPSVLAKLSQAETSQGVVAVARKLAPEKPKVPEFGLYLEELQDPGNLGTLIRTSRAAGVDHILVRGGADVWGPKVIRASAGALFHLPCLEVDEPPAPPARLVGAVARGGVPLFELDLSGPVVVAIGNEARGLSQQTVERCDQLVTVPMRSGCESLNAAVSGALIVYERYRFSG